MSIIDPSSLTMNTPAGETRLPRPPWATGSDDEYGGTRRVNPSATAHWGEWAKADEAETPTEQVFLSFTAEDLDILTSLTASELMDVTGAAVAAFHDTAARIRVRRQS